MVKIVRIILVVMAIMMATMNTNLPPLNKSKWWIPTATKVGGDYDISGGGGDDGDD